jgi:hypothetical protein
MAVIQMAVIQITRENLKTHKKIKTPHYLRDIIEPCTQDLYLGLPFENPSVLP